jgi:hypothetical protein
MTVSHVDEAGTRKRLHVLAADNRVKSDHGIAAAAI